MLSATSSVAAKGNNQAAYHVNSAYLELRSGPGRGFPIIFSLKNNERLSILSRKTQWIEVISQDDNKGWMHENKLPQLSLNKQQVSFQPLDHNAYREKTLELGFYTGGVSGGSNKNTPLIALSGAWQFTENYALEATLNHIVASNEENFLAHLDLQHTLAPEWFIHPIFTIGIGQLYTQPKSTLGDAATIKSSTVNMGLGFKYPVYQRFIIRGDYHKHLIISDQNQLNSVLIWKLGISVFF